MGFLSDDDREKLKPSELLPYDTPIPTQVVSSDEFYPFPQTEKQRELQARLLDLADGLAKKQGVSRRRFFQTAAGMAASYAAMNGTAGNFFDRHACRSRDAGDGRQLRQSAQRPVHHGHAHAFPAR